MTDLIIKLFIKNPEDTSSPSVREAYGVLAAFVGVVINLLLCAAKFIVGMWSGSIAIQADAANNLSDIGSSVVTFIGFKAANRPADKEHPFGHARVEYIAALVVSFLILLVAFELGKESVSKILNPTPVEYSPVTMVVLAISILGKLYLGSFTRKVGKRIDSSALAASTMDSICDVISTGAILISTVIGYFTNLNLDGYIGILVALFVLYAGISILKETVSPLMGEAPDPA
ncbi:MAG: cation transporter, partial [Clostridia bacterium]|nr:cation transporter [Clostridia bacterium]